MSLAEGCLTCFPQMRLESSSEAEGIPRPIPSPKTNLIEARTLQFCNPLVVAVPPHRPPAQSLVWYFVIGPESCRRNSGCSGSRAPSFLPCRESGDEWQALSTDSFPPQFHSPTHSIQFHPPALLPFPPSALLEAINNITHELRAHSAEISNMAVPSAVC